MGNCTMVDSQNSVVFWLDTLRVMFGTEDFMMCTTLVSLSITTLHEWDESYVQSPPHTFFFFFFFFYLVVTHNPITINSYL